MTRPLPSRLGRRARSSLIVAAIVSVFGLLAMPAAVSAQPDPFTCYRAHTLAGTPKFASVAGVSLVDRFGVLTANVLREERLCASTDVAGADPTAPTHPDHVMAYKLWKPLPHFTRVYGLGITDQFGAITVTVIKPDRVLVPSAKSLLASPPPPASPAVGHFTCYKVRATTPFVPIAGLALQDQFRTMSVDVRKPVKLCTPVNKNDESPGAETDPHQLLCYKIRLTSGSPKILPVSPIFVSDQFGALTLESQKVAELCVPALLP